MIKEERKISYERDNTMSNDYSRRSCDVTESGPSPIANGPVAGSPVVVRRTYSTVTLPYYRADSSLGLVPVRVVAKFAR